MAFHYNIHYTLEEARSLLPLVRRWLASVQQIKARMREADQRILYVLNMGDDAGGERVNQLVECMASVQEVLAEFSKREIQVKDIDRGLIDFPSLRNGQEVFLCWEQDEDDIEHWHDIETGYEGRHPI